MSEVWKPVVGFEGYYEVSDQGRVYRKPRVDPLGRTWKPAMLSQQTYKAGYKRVMLTIPSVRKFASVHCLVLEAFKGSRPKGYEGAHLNGVKADNRKRNLAWKTPKENCRDRIAHGTDWRGEDVGTSKLTSAKVKRIRTLYASGGYRQADLGRMFHVNQAHISQVVLRKCWAHV